MGELTAKTSGDLIHLMHEGDGDAMPMPFEREIYLFDTYVAGTTHIPNIDALEPFIHEGSKLNFVREPSNAYDHMAIRVEMEDGQKIGFVPQDDNVVFARLMDAGKFLFGRVTAKTYKGSWLRIDFRVYLKD